MHENRRTRARQLRHDNAQRAFPNTDVDHLSNAEEVRTFVLTASWPSLPISPRSC